MIKKSKRYLSLVLTMAMLLPNIVGVTNVSAATISKEIDVEEKTNNGYEIYPTPHNIKYNESDFIIRKDVNVVYESKVDNYTKDRLEEVAALKNLNVTESDDIVKGKTNILVGIKDSGEYVDKYADKYNVEKENLFEETDSYLLSADDEVITILGKDTDSAFYGLTTLYQVVKQLESYTIKNFIIEDYADVVSRGFIEGYYGNPWSTQDRVNLMKFGGYYKLNSYFYAPKDDPKHRVKWRELYTEEELKWVKELADAGNKSKCRFVYAIHPFPYEDPLKFTEDRYEKDLADLKAKLSQVIDNGVRQIAILADDFVNPGGENGLRLVNDVTNWLRDEVKVKYPDMKITFPYVPYDYMGDGSGNEFTYLKQSPENVQLVMTGGQVWGSVNKDFVERFTNNVGRGPYMWVNWPCSDNSKNHLIMGGNEVFLKPGVPSDKVEGIILNPMQQSEPSKVAIFANAEYSWNIWETEQQAKKAWHDSFKYVDHNSALENKASTALRELSKHMIAQNTGLDESFELKQRLSDINTKLKNKTLNESDLDLLNDLENEFTILKNASQYYKTSAGDKNLQEQIMPFLNCWVDTSDSALSYITSLKASIQGDVSKMISNYTSGQASFTASKKYGYHYVNHTEYAEVGWKHIVPFIKNMEKYLSEKVEQSSNPNKPEEPEIGMKDVEISTEHLSVRGGSLNNIIDGNNETYVHLAKGPYENPGRDTIPANATLTFTFKNPKKLGIISLKQDGSNDKLVDAAIEYSVDGTNNWTEVGTLKGESDFSLDVSDEGISAKAIRIRNKTERAYWWKLFEVGVTESKGNTPIKYNLIKSESWSQYDSNSYPLSNLNDKNDNTFVWYNPGNQDTVQVNDFIGYDFGKIATLKSAHIVVGAGDGDKLSNYAIETSINNKDWTLVKGYENYKGVDSGKDILDINLENTEARYIRIRNLQNRNKWVKFSEFTVKEQIMSEHLYTNVDTDIVSVVTPESAQLTNGSVILEKGDYIGLKLDNIKEIEKIEVEPSPSTNIKLQTSQNALIWTDVKLDGLFKTKNYEDARYIRLINTGDAPQTIELKKFVVTSNEIFEKGFYDSNIEINSAYGQNDMRKIGNSNEIFDKNLSTGAILAGYPTQDGYVTFDLGQEIDINNISYYVSETEINFIRDAVFEVSNNPKSNDWKEVLTIGDGVENNNCAQLNVKQYSATEESNGEYLHDTQNPGNMYVSSKDVNATGRYLRVRFSAPYRHRFATFNEIVINNGKYYPVENNKNYDSNVIEEEGKQPSNMNDGDLTTTYKPSQENGYITYRISEPEGIKSIRFIQKGKSSNAKVEGLLYSDGKTESVRLGTLNQTITEFIIPKGKLPLEIKISWESNIPEISEIFLSSNDTSNVDKNELNKEIEKTADENWTSSSKEAYNEALEIAKEIATNEYASQEMVNMALEAIKAARSNAKIKADTTKLEEMVNNVLDNTNHTYSISSYAIYESVLNNIVESLKDKENLSKEEALKLEKEMEDAKNNLVYSIHKREEAELIIKDAPDYKEENYTIESYSNMVVAKEELKNAVELDKKAENAKRISPEEMDEKIKKYNTSIDNLVDISALRESINEFESYDKEIYTPESYEAYRLAVELGKGLLNNGTEEEVNAAIENILEAKLNLKIQESSPLEEVIDDAKKVNGDDYTEKSYKRLQQAIANAEGEVDSSQVEDLIEDINNAKNNLVSVVALKSKISEIELLDETKYTKSSFKKLTKLVEQSSSIIKNGTTKKVNSMVEDMEKAIRSLEMKAQCMEKYIESIILKDKNKYTANTYAAYKNAYKKLTSLPIDDTSEEEFNNAKNDFEKAENNLTLKK